MSDDQNRFGTQLIPRPEGDNRVHLDTGEPGAKEVLLLLSQAMGTVDMKVPVGSIPRKGGWERMHVIALPESIEVKEYSHLDVLISVFEAPVLTYMAGLGIVPTPTIVTSWQLSHDNPEVMWKGTSLVLQNVQSGEIEAIPVVHNGSIQFRRYDASGEFIMWFAGPFG